MFDHKRERKNERESERVRERDGERQREKVVLITQITTQVNKFTYQKYNPRSTFAKYEFAICFYYD